MKKWALLAAMALAASGVSALTSTQASAAPGASPRSVFVGTLNPMQLGLLRAAGVDREDVVAARGAGNTARVEAVLTPDQAAELSAKGLPLTEKVVRGQKVSDRLAARAAAGHTVFRSYSEPGGLKDEYTALARQYPAITKLVVIGRSVQGQEIVAIKLTKNAKTVADGARPAVLYTSAQHAREWITPEMNRRLLRLLLQRYATDASIRTLVDSTELWFVPVANPDGYDYSFSDDRLWRKNLADNDGDGQITTADGVDPNRNFPYKWGYDNEGSSPDISSATYRGPSPASEPETQALDALMRRIGFAFHVNYHSAAELLLYGVGWQVATPSPDDLIYEAMVGDDADPAVPGYDPDISAELYTTNGETTDHAQNTYGTLAFTPEMATCETASAVDPTDAFDPADCESVFNFPDSEPLVQSEFEKNLPFALAVGRSARTPATPVSVVGRRAPEMKADTFATSYGSPQPVAVTARRSLEAKTLHYSINGGAARTAPVEVWKGGERYGDGGNRYYAEYRGSVTGTAVGDRVRVWFTGTRGNGSTATSDAFTYTVARTADAQVLVLANEDYEGVNPTYPSTVQAPKYASVYRNALRSRGVTSLLWDVSARGVPHHLGVLGHFDTVLWYLGDNRLTQDPDDELTTIFGDPYEDAAVAERQQYLTLSVRDYLNEGGKLVHAGETAQYYGQFGGLIGGVFYGLDGAPAADCVVAADLFSDCLLLADDFSQYYLGAAARTATAGPTGFTGSGRLDGVDLTLTGTPANPLDEAGTFSLTSQALPADRFPLFAGRSAGSYTGAAGGAYDPVEGGWYVGSTHTDGAYMRLTRTIDLTGVTAAQAPALQAQLSFDTEPDYDQVIVEARTIGRNDATTLPEAGGLSTTAVPAECEVGFLLAQHPWLQRYLTLAASGCSPTGTTGSWNAMTGNSGGWQQTEFDLSAYAGRQVQVTISYVTDSAFGGVGAFIDDTAVVVGGQRTRLEGFETGLGAWSVPGPPPGSPEAVVDFTRSRGALSAAVATRDTLLLGFGLEQVAPAARPQVLADALAQID